MLLAIMATVLAFALILLVEGVYSLATGRDVIEEPEAGPLVGVAMVLVSCVVVLVLSLGRTPVGLPLAAVAAALAVVVLSPLAGALVYSVVRGQLGALPVFFGAHVLDPFVIASAAVAALVVLANRVVRMLR